jgi:hypothetical protein
MHTLTLHLLACDSLQDKHLCAKLTLVGHVEAIALLATGASVAAGSSPGDCLTSAVMSSYTAALRLLLQAWQAPPVGALRKAVKTATVLGHCDAAVLLLRQLGKQDMAAAAEVMQTMPIVVLQALAPALLDAVLGSEEEQQAVALQDEARQLAEQRRGLQQLAVGFAGMYKQADTGLRARPCSASSDKCSEGECTAGAAAGVSAGVVSVRDFLQASAAAGEAGDAGCVSVDGGHCRPGINKGRVNRRERGP